MGEKDIAEKTLEAWNALNKLSEPFFDKPKKLATGNFFLTVFLF